MSILIARPRLPTFLSLCFLLPTLAAGRGLSSEDEMVFRLRSAFALSASVPISVAQLSTRSLTKRFACDRRSASRGTKSSTNFTLAFHEQPDFAHTYQNSVSPDFKRFAFGVGVGSKREELVGLKERNVSTQIHDVLFVRLNERDEKLVAPGFLIEETRVPKTVELDEENRKLFTKDALDHEESVGHLRGLALAYHYCPLKDMEWAFSRFSSSSSIPVKYIQTVNGPLVKIQSPAAFQVGGIHFAPYRPVVLNYETQEIFQGKLTSPAVVGAFSLGAGEFEISKNALISGTLADAQKVNGLSLPAGSVIESHRPGVFSQVTLPTPAVIGAYELQGRVLFDNYGRVVSGTLSKSAKSGKFEFSGPVHFIPGGAIYQGVLSAAHTEASLVLPAGTEVELDSQSNLISFTAKQAVRVGALSFLTSERVYPTPSIHFATGKTAWVTFTEDASLPPHFIFAKGSDVRLSDDWVPSRLRTAGRSLVAGMPVDAPSAEVSIREGYWEAGTRTRLATVFSSKAWEFPAGSTVIYGAKGALDSLTLSAGTTARVGALTLKAGSTITFSPVRLPREATLAVGTDFDGYPLAADSKIKIDEVGRLIEGTLSRDHVFKGEVRLSAGSQFSVFLGGYLRSFQSKKPVTVAGMEFAQLTLSEAGRPKLGIVSRPTILKDIVQVEAGSTVEFNGGGDVALLRPFGKRLVVDGNSFEAAQVSFAEGKYPLGTMKLLKAGKVKQLDFEAGVSLSLYDDGRAWRAWCGDNDCSINRIKFVAKRQVDLHPENSFPREGYLAGEQSVGACVYADRTRLELDAKGQVTLGFLAKPCRVRAIPANPQSGEVVARAQYWIRFRADGGPKELMLAEPYSEWIPPYIHEGKSQPGYLVQWLPLPEKLKLDPSDPTIVFTAKGNVTMGFISQVKVSIGTLTYPKQGASPVLFSFRCTTSEGSLLIFRPEVIDIYEPAARFQYPPAVALASCGGNSVSGSAADGQYLYDGVYGGKWTTKPVRSFFGSNRETHAIYRWQGGSEFRSARVQSSAALLEKAYGKCVSGTAFEHPEKYDSLGSSFYFTPKALDKCL